MKVLTDRYLHEVAPQKRSYRAMRYDLLALGHHFHHRTLATLTAADVAGSAMGVSPEAPQAPR